MKLSVVFSFRNEETVLPELVRRVALVLGGPSCDYELIFVNDASTDHSLQVLTRLRETNNRIKIVNMSRRFGVTPCVMAGFAAATGDAVMYMDSDLQDPPELIPQLMQKWQEGADVVHTVRVKRHGESRLKMWLTRRAYKLINAFSDIDLHENAGDFKLFSRRAVDEILRLREHDPYMRGLAIWIGFNQAIVYYERDSRHTGDSKFGLFHSLSPYKEFVRGFTSFSASPLYMALFMGFFVAAGAFLLLLYILYTKLAGLNLPGWSAIMAAVLSLSSVILLTIGVLGIYIGRIYDQIKGRPSFIVADKIGFDVREDKP